MISVDAIIEHFEGVTSLARQLGCTSQAISAWKREGTIPELRAFQIEMLSKGKFKADRLPIRPRSRHSVLAQ
jgi:hypothetical protein